MKQTIQPSSPRRLAPIVAALTLALGVASALARPLGIDSDFGAGSPDWPTVRSAGVRFACIKCTQHADWSNAHFANRMSGAQAAGIYTIPYHRCDPSVNKPKTEANYFWNTAQGSLHAGGYNLSPALDIEDGLTGTYIGDNGSAISLAGWCNEWFNDVNALAKANGVNLKQLTYVNVGSMCYLGNSDLGGHLWLADPCGCDPQTGSPYTCGGCSISGAWDGCEPTGGQYWNIWQYEWYSQMSSPPYPGLIQRADLDVYHDTVSDMVSRLGTRLTFKIRDDVNGDYLDDFALWTPSNGDWTITFSSDGSTHTFHYGMTGDIPLLDGDFNGDGCADAVVFRPSNGTWYIRYSSDASSHHIIYGMNGDIPLLGGDWDGDGIPDPVVFRPSTSTWYIRFSSDGSSHHFQYGTSGDIPLLNDGDFDGDGCPDAVIFRPSDGSWHIRYSKGGSSHGFQFGTNGDIPSLGDYDGDGIPDATVFTPSTGDWSIRFSSDSSIHTFHFGSNGDIPWSSHTTPDNAIDQELYRPSTGTFYVRDGNTGNYTSITLGTSGDIPVY